MELLQNNVVCKASLFCFDCLLEKYVVLVPPLCTLYIFKNYYLVQNIVTFSADSSIQMYYVYYSKPMPKKNLAMNFLLHWQPPLVAQT